MKRKGKILEVHTDGACSGNQSEENIGGWGAILKYGKHEKEIYGGELNTSNNRMELTALLKALQSIKKPKQNIAVFSDSSYLISCFKDQWYVKWQKNNWRTAAKTPVDNRDLWEELLPFLKVHDIRFYKVKGHVNFNSKVTDFQDVFEKFKEWNGPEFNYDDFLYVTKQNHRADKLANMGIESMYL